MLLVCLTLQVSHVDPGDWATTVEGGSRFGFKLVWVVVLSHVIAIHLQNLAARLGLVTGQHLAQVCRQHYPRLVCWLLWLLCEVRWPPTRACLHQQPLVLLTPAAQRRSPSWRWT